jgi:hypothetical protein
VLRHLLGIGEAPVWFSFDNASVTRVDVLGESSARAVRLVYLNRRADDARGLFG